jgi:ethanolaminephosphotransferase
MYLTFGIGLFTYQALDAIDGKQARRTGTSSPLGQLFDHGCDALNTSLGAVLAISALDLGTSNWALLSVMATTLNFFLTTWEEYYTGVLYLGYINGPVEGVLFLVMVFIVSFFYGPGIWSQNVFPEVQMIIKKIPYVSSWLLNGSVMKWNELFVLTMLIPVVGSLIVSFYNVYGAVRAQGKSFISTFLGLIPMLTCLTLIYIILQKYSFIQEKYLAEFILATGMASANMVGRLIVAHVVHDDIPLYTPYYLILGAVAFINLEAHLSHIQIIYTLLSVSVAVHAHFCFSVMSQISNYMSIRVFHVTKKSKKNTN